jgi:prepilin-type N-terminal cleavage/methylation domain-containing protein
MKRRGFTMIEMLVATALAALVLIALNTLIFSMTEMWGSSHGRRNFDLHVRALSAFLEQELRTAALPPGGQAGTAGITWQAASSTQVGAAANSNAVLTFTLAAGSRLLPWPVNTEPSAKPAMGGAGPTARALPDVVCSLQVRPNEGLYLLWHSQYETGYTSDPPRETLISPLVTAIQYDYYDTMAQQWTTEDGPLANNSGQLLPPNRLRLTFTYDKQVQVMPILLPVAPQGLPPF